MKVTTSDDAQEKCFITKQPHKRLFINDLPITITLIMTIPRAPSTVVSL